MVWDKTDVVHMDDAMAVPATGGFYKSIAHHFYEVRPGLYSRCAADCPVSQLHMCHVQHQGLASAQHHKAHHSITKHSVALHSTA